HRGVVRASVRCPRWQLADDLRWRGRHADRRPSRHGAVHARRHTDVPRVAARRAARQQLLVDGRALRVAAPRDLAAVRSGALRRHPRAGGRDAQAIRRARARGPLRVVGLHWRPNADRPVPVLARLRRRRGVASSVHDRPACRRGLVVRRVPISAAVLRLSATIGRRLPGRCFDDRVPPPKANMKTRRLVIGGVVVVVLALVALWVQQTLEVPPRLSAVPIELTTRAVVPGIPNARYWVLSDVEPLVRDALAARQREEAFLSQSGRAGELPPLELLAISGGGDKGAFGAVLLNGWTASGTRPTFKLVTGVSTGALIAPFAFLGPEYDKVLEEVYTTLSPEDVARPRSIIAAIQNDGMADNEPLWTLISKYVDERLLAAIAAEHEKGRILLIGTTDLDARQPVIWNVGNIAASGSSDALRLFRSILLASAAIPGAFPPTLVDVEADGKRYQEMHVDGGASSQVFLYPPSMGQVA